MARFAIRIDDELAEQLTEQASESGISRNQLISELLESALAGKPIGKAQAKFVAQEARNAVLAALGYPVR